MRTCLTTDAETVSQVEDETGAEPAIDFTATSLLAFALADTLATQPDQAGRND